MGIKTTSYTFHRQELLHDKFIYTINHKTLHYSQKYKTHNHVTHYSRLTSALTKFTTTKLKKPSKRQLRLDKQNKPCFINREHKNTDIRDTSGQSTLKTLVDQIDA